MPSRLIHGERLLLRRSVSVNVSLATRHGSDHREAQRLGDLGGPIRLPIAQDDDSSPIRPVVVPAPLPARTPERADAQERVAPVDAVQSPTSRCSPSACTDTAMVRPPFTSGSRSDPASLGTSRRECIVSVEGRLTGSGLVDPFFFQCEVGNPVKASSSSWASRCICSTLGSFLPASRR